MASRVEGVFIERSGHEFQYPDVEKVPIITVENIYELGKLVALRFLEWVLVNPTGVVALPTGRTPEYFIKTLELFKKTWTTDATQQELVKYGFDTRPEFPDMTALKFVMLDEFFPMNPMHRNSFCNYVERFYTKPMGILKENVISFDLLDSNVLSLDELGLFSSIDLDISLVTEPEANLSSALLAQKEILGKVQRFCNAIDDKIRGLGGIGFFLGGIGPDGHIAFNQEGSAHDSRTRLVNFNYPTAAAAAGDLGGIEIARGKGAMTIGLGTIGFNKSASIIIMAAGEGKAEVVRSAIEEPADVSRPASLLHTMPGGRFYLTNGAASKLTARKNLRLSNTSQAALDWALLHLGALHATVGVDQAHLAEAPLEYLAMEDLLYSASLRNKVPVHLLTLQHLNNPCVESSGRIGSSDNESASDDSTNIPRWLRDPLSFRVMISCASRRLREKVNRIRE